MNAETRFSGAGGASDKPLLTMGDVRRWKEQARTLKQRREEHLSSVKIIDQEIEALEKKLGFAEMFMGETVDAVAPETEAALPLEHAPRTKMIPVFSRRARRNADRSSADTYMRSLAYRMGEQRPEGFSASDFMEVFATDENIPAEHRGVHRTYFYSALKRLRIEGVLDRRFDRYYGAGKAPPEERPSPGGPAIPGYKLVPLTKEERVRHEIRHYLKHRKDNTAHRAQIADQLVQIGVFENMKNIVQTVSVYLSKWPEFAADGSGNITLDKTQLTNDDP